MYVCICNALTERSVAAAIRDRAPGTVSGVYAACGAQPQCGKCAPDMADLLSAARPCQEILAAE